MTHKGLVPALLVSAGIFWPPLCPAQNDDSVDQVVVINPGIWHIWFDEKPSQEIVDRFAAIEPQGRQVRVIRALTIEYDAGSRQYREKPVWLLDFHWDPIIVSASEQGVPVYVTVEPGIDMHEASKPLRTTKKGPELSAEQVRWLEEHAVSGGTVGARENHRRIREVYFGVRKKFPNADIDTFNHSQSGRNFIGALKELYYSDREAFDDVVSHLGHVDAWDPALTPVAESVASTPGLGAILRKAYEWSVGHKAGLSEHELARTDKPTWQGGDGKPLHYADYVNEKDEEFIGALRSPGTEYRIGVAKGTVSSRRAGEWAKRLGAEFHDPKEMGERVGQSGLSTSNIEGHVREPWVEPVKDHSLKAMNGQFLDFIGIPASPSTSNASEFNPAYTSEHFRNSVVADMGSLVQGSDGPTDGSQVRPDRIENVPVWDNANGNPDDIAAETVRAMRGSTKQTVVIDPAGREELARQVGAIIEGGGGKVIYAKGLDDPVAQTVAGRQLTAVVVRLGPADAGSPSGPAGKPETGDAESTSGPAAPGRTSGTPVRLQIDPNSLISIPASPEDMLQAVGTTVATEGRPTDAALQKPPVGVSVYVGSVPLGPDPMSEEGWTVERVGQSNWFHVQHETWESSELVYDGSEDSADRIVSEVKEKVKELTGEGEEDSEEGEGESGKPKKVVIGGDPDDPRVREVIRELNETDEDSDGEPDYEIVFVNCEGMSPRQAMRKVAIVVRAEDAILGEAMVYLPGDGESPSPSGDSEEGYKVPSPNETPEEYPIPAGEEDEEEKERRKRKKKKDDDDDPPPPPSLLAAGAPLADGAEGGSGDHDDPVRRRLAAIRQRIADGGGRPHVLDVMRDLRTEEASPVLDERPEDLDEMQFEQSGLLIQLRDVELSHRQLRYAVDESLRQWKAAADPAPFRGRLARWQREHARLQQRLDWMLRQSDLWRYQASLRNQFWQLRMQHEEFQKLLARPVPDRDLVPRLEGLRDQVARLHWTHAGLRESLIGELHGTNLRMQQAAVRRQMQDFYRDMSATTSSLLQGHAAANLPALPGRIERLKGRLVALQDAFPAGRTGFQPLLRGEQMRALQRDMSRLRTSLAGNRVQPQPVKLDHDLARLEQLTTRTQQRIERLRPVVDPVALHDRLAGLSTSLQRANDLLRQDPGRLQPIQLRRDLHSLSRNVAGIDRALGRNSIGLKAPLLRSDLQQLKRQLTTTRSLLDLKPAKITPASFQAHFADLDRWMTRTRTSLDKTRLAARPLALEHGLSSFQNEMASMRRLLHQGSTRIEKPILELHTARLQDRLSTLNGSLKLAPTTLATDRLRGPMTELGTGLLNTRQWIRQTPSMLQPAALQDRVAKLDIQMAKLHDPLTQTQSAIRPLVMESRLADFEDNLTRVRQMLRVDLPAHRASAVQRQMQDLGMQASRMHDLSGGNSALLRSPSLEPRFTRLHEQIRATQHELRQSTLAQTSPAWTTHFHNSWNMFSTAWNNTFGMGSVQAAEVDGISRPDFSRMTGVKAPKLPGSGQLDTPRIDRLKPDNLRPSLLPAPTFKSFAPHRFGGGTLAGPPSSSRLLRDFNTPSSPRRFAIPKLQSPSLTQPLRPGPLSGALPRPGTTGLGISKPTIPRPSFPSATFPKPTFTPPKISPPRISAPAYRPPSYTPRPSYRPPSMPRISPSFP